MKIRSRSFPSFLSMVCLFVGWLLIANGSVSMQSPTGGIIKLANPVVRRTQTHIPSRAATAARNEGKIDERVEQALESGNAARDAGDAEKAKGFYQRAASINPKEARAYLGLGNVEMDHYTDYYPNLELEKTAIKRAEGYYQQASLLKPHEWSAYFDLGVVYDVLTAFDSAAERNLQNQEEAAFKKAIALDSGAIDAWGWLGGLYLEENRLGDAESAYRRAIALRPDLHSKDNVALANAYEGLGDLLSRQNRDAEAAKVYSDWALADPGNWIPHDYLGMTYVKLGNKKAATEQYQFLRNVQPERAQMLLSEINKMKD